MTLLETHALNAFYGDFQAVFNVDFHIDRGETVAIVGANGAGKTTFLRALVGMLRCARKMIIFDGQPVGGRAAHDVVRFGVAMVPEARKLFPSLTVEENLRIGGYVKRQGNWNSDASTISFQCCKNDATYRQTTFRAASSRWRR